jgi:hypothetical protein
MNTPAGVAKEILAYAADPKAFKSVRQQTA